MTKTFPITIINGNPTCLELPGYELPECSRCQEDDIDIPNGCHEEFEFGYEAGYRKAREKYEFTKQDLIDLVQALKDYTSECHVILGHDEWDAFVFVDIFLAGRNRTPIAIEVEMVVNCTGNNDNGCFMDASGHDCGCIKPAKNPDGTLKGRWVYE